MTAHGGVSALVPWHRRERGRVDSDTHGSATFPAFCRPGRRPHSAGAPPPEPHPSEHLHLSGREKLVLVLRYELSGAVRLPWEMVAERVGVPAGQALDLHDRALDKLGRLTCASLAGDLISDAGQSDLTTFWPIVARVEQGR